MVSQARVRWRKLFAECWCYKMVVNSGKNIIYEDQDEINLGDDKNYSQTRGPKEARFCVKQWRKRKCIKYLVPKTLCKCFNMNIPQNKHSAPWAMHALRKSSILLLMWRSLLHPARPSATMSCVSNIFSRKPSANILIWMARKINSAHLEL